MVQVKQLTAENLLGAPRRGVALPNRTGTLALHTLSTHDFTTHKTLKEVHVVSIDADSQISRVISDSEKVHDAVWIPGTDSQIIYLKSLDKGRTEVAVADVSDADKEHYTVTEFDAPVSTLKLKALDDGSVAFVVAGLVGEDGEMYNEETAEKPSTGRIFDNCNIRCWNVYFKAQRYSLWYSKLVLQNAKWALASALSNLVPDPKIEAPYGMYDLFDPLSNFDICHRGIAFMGRNLAAEADPLVSFASYPYFVALDSFTLPPTASPRKITIPAGVRAGFGTNVRFSPGDAANIAFLHGETEDMYNNRVYMTSVDSLEAFDAIKTINKVEHWENHDPPASFEFAGAPDAIVMSSERKGRVLLSHVKLRDGEKPRFITSRGSASGCYPLREGDWTNVLVSSSSFVDSSLWEVVDIASGGVARTVSSATKGGAKFGLSHEKMVSEIWYEGADGLSVQSWMLKPSDFDESKKYPWLFLPHGGPVSGWNDGWSTRWNAASWAEQGYVVILPNCSGSTGFGTDFAHRSNGSWGGNPYVDLLKLIEHLETIPFLDQNKAILAGASYSGYLFCCAVWHDGVYNTITSELHSDIIFDIKDFLNPPFPWSNFDELQKYNPVRPELLRNWARAPPTIVIHSEKDYRCTITEGLAAFKTLNAQGVPSRFLTFPDEGHWVLGPENALLWHQTVWDWVRRCVDGELKRGDKAW